MGNQINYELIGYLARRDRSANRLEIVKSKIIRLSYARFNINMIKDIFEDRGNLSIVWKDDISVFMLRDEIEKLWQSYGECWVSHYKGDTNRHYFTTLDGQIQNYSH